MTLEEEQKNMAVKFVRLDGAMPEKIIGSLGGADPQWVWVLGSPLPARHRLAP